MTEQNNIVRLRRDGIALSVIDPSEHVRTVVSRTLTYNKIEFLRGWKAQQRGAKMICTPTACYRYQRDSQGILPSRIVTAAGYLPLLNKTLRDNGYRVLLADDSPPDDPRVFTPYWDRLAEQDFRYRQRELLELLLRVRMGRIDCPTGFGKAQPLCAWIQTPCGPRLMGDMHAGSEVCTPRGSIAKVSSVHPQGKKLIYRVTFADGDSVECCDDHLWEVHSRKLGFAKPKILSLKSMRQRYLSPSGEQYFSVRVPQPLRMAERALAIPSYLMGVLLGDGCFRAASPTIANSDDEVLARVRALLLPGYVLRTRKNRIQHGLVWHKKRKKPNFYRKVLEELQLYGKKSEEKFIPVDYLYNSKANRWELLRGLMDTDGTVSKNAHTSYSSSSPALAKNVKWLVESLGGICRIQPKATDCLLNYICSISIDRSERLFYLSRKRTQTRLRTKYHVKRIIADIRPVGYKEAQCITLDSAEGLYLTDSCVVTHNSFLIACLCRLLPKATIHVSTHSADVIRQLYNDLRAWLPSVGIVGAGKHIAGQRVTCFCGKSLHRSDGRAHILVIDEVHEMASPDYMRKLLPYRYARRFGFSASHDDRMDGADFELMGAFGPVIFRIGYEDAVANDCVVPIEVRWYDVWMDVSPCAGYDDSTARDRWGLWRNEVRNRIIAEAAREFVAESQVLITVTTVEHAMFLKRELPEFTLCHGDKNLSAEGRERYIRWGCIGRDEPEMTLNRREHLKDEFSAGRLRHVIATSVWNRGVDFRQLSVLIRADGQNSPIADTQIPGRVSRISTETGKQSGLIIDFRDQFDDRYRRKARTRQRHYEERGWQQILPEEQRRFTMFHGH